MPEKEYIFTILPIAISTVALVISALSLGWNIYRDVILKPRLRVRFFAINTHNSSGACTGQALDLRITNLGPGHVICQRIMSKTDQFWFPLVRERRYAMVLPDNGNPLSGKLPAKLDVGEQIDLLLPYEQRCFLSQNDTHVGVLDSFGRLHWAPANDVTEARKQYEKDFGEDRDASP